MRGTIATCNALVTCILIVSARSEDLNTFFPPGLRSVFKGLLMTERVVHIWKNPFWRMMMRDWAQPAMQHDIAEFLQFLVRKNPSLEDRIGIMWASKMEEQGIIRCHDGGCSAPLFLQPPERCLQGQGSVMVQHLVDKWHQQARMHAALRCPDNLVLQASRFHFDVHTGVTTKLGYEIIPDREVWFPVFVDGMQVVHVRFRLRAFALHLGSAPDCGHYKAVMLQQEDFYIADDGAVFEPGSERVLAEGCHNSYMFFYHKADQA